MKTKRTNIFQPFQKVWTPRTPDSNYDSLGPLPVQPIVNAPLITEGLSEGIAMLQGVFETPFASGSSTEGTGYGITLQAASYTPVPAS